MGLIKPNNYSKTEIRIYQKLAACSNPARMRMIALMRQSPATLDEIREKVNLSKSSVGEHMQILRRAGLIKTSCICHFLYYAVNETSLCEIEKVIRNSANRKTKKPSAVS